jgi:hypothetical protein
VVLSFHRFLPLKRSSIPSPLVSDIWGKIYRTRNNQT